MQIKYLDRSAINDTLWNRCIDNSVNGIIYTYTWYLDIVSPGWCALVDINYNYVFPLPDVKRFGVDTLLQPLFTQQLGLFSSNHITPEILQEFVQNIPQKYRYINIHLNTMNRLSNNFHLSERITYHLDLIAHYNIIQKKYSQNTRRNNLKAHALGVNVVKNISPESFLNLFKANGSIKFNCKKYNQIERIVDVIISKGKGEIIGAYSNGILCAAAFTVTSNGKLVYLFACSSPIGLKNRAMFVIVDQIISWNSESHLVLDFEGSMIPSVARFYSGFGAKPCNFQHIVINRLPLYAKLMFNIKSTLTRFIK